MVSSSRCPAALLFTAAMLALLLLGLPAALRAEDPAEPLPVVSAERGLAVAEAERKPCFVIVLPDGDAAAYRTALAERLRGSTRTKLAEDFVTIEVVLGAERAWPEVEPPAGPPEPWSGARARGWLEGRLGPLGEAPLVALLDFSGVLVARFDGEPPAEAKLKKGIRGAGAANEARRKLFANAERGLEKLGLALKRKLYPEACRIFLELRALDLPLESKPAVDREALHQELERAWRAKLDDGKKLEEKEKLPEAVVEYEKILQEFPIPEWQEELRRKIGTLWRKIYGPNPPVLGGP